MGACPRREAAEGRKQASATTAAIESGAAASVAVALRAAAAARGRRISAPPALEARGAVAAVCAEAAWARPLGSPTTRSLSTTAALTSPTASVTPASAPAAAAASAAASSSRHGRLEEGDERLPINGAAVARAAAAAPAMAARPSAAAPWHLPASGVPLRGVMAAEGGRGGGEPHQHPRLAADAASAPMPRGLAAAPRGGGRGGVATATRRQRRGRSGAAAAGAAGAAGWGEQRTALPRNEVAGERPREGPAPTTGCASSTSSRTARCPRRAPPRTCNAPRAPRRPKEGDQRSHAKTRNRD